MPRLRTSNAVNDSEPTPERRCEQTTEHPPHDYEYAFETKCHCPGVVPTPDAGTQSDAWSERQITERAKTAREIAAKPGILGGVTVHPRWLEQVAEMLEQSLRKPAAPDAPTPDSIDGISMADINLLREIAQRGIEDGVRCNYRPTPRTLLALANVAARAFAPESRPSEAS
jgi:hypothetical protein